MFFTVKARKQALAIIVYGMAIIALSIVSLPTSALRLGTGNMTQTINYNDSRLSYLGRWFNPGTGMQSAWQGSQLRFKISGTTTVSVNASIVDSSGSSLCALGVNIDQGDTLQCDLSTNAESVTANRTATITLPDTGLHTVLIKTSANLPDAQLANTSKIIITSLDIADASVLTSWLQTGLRRVICVGDSWMGAWMDWPRFMDPALITIYPVGFGGATAASMVSAYPYLVGSTSMPDEPFADLVIIGLGVNDYNGSVSISSFQTSITSLVDLVRAKQWNAKIVLIQPIRNTRDSKPYDVYTEALAAVTLVRSNVVLLQTCSIWSQLTWATADNAHLDFASRQILANHVAQQLMDLTTLPKIEINNSTGIFLEITPPLITSYNGGFVLPDGSIGKFLLVPDDGVPLSKIVTSAGLMRIYAS